MDNLGSDLENLGGAADTFFIQLGEGAQGPLRLVVQTLTELVTLGGDVLGFWNSLPGPVQTAVVALAGVAALKGPVSSAFETIALRAMYMSDSVAGASVSMGGLRAAGAGLLGVFGGPWGLAIAGAATGLSLLTSWLGESEDASAGAAAEQTNLAQALERTKGAIDKTVRAAAAEDLVDSGLSDWARRLGIDVTVMTDAILGVPGALDEVNGAFDTYIGGQRQDIVDATGAINAGFTDQGIAARDARAAFGELAGVTGETVAKQQEIAAATAATGDAMNTSLAQTQAAQQALADWIEEQSKIGASFIEPLDVYKGLLDKKTTKERKAAEATAAATASSEDSWRDYVGEVTVSLDEYATQLEEQILAQENWRANVVTVTQRGGVEVGQILADMGVEGAQITAQMATATEGDFQRMKDALIRESRLGSEGAAAELANGMRVAEAVARAGASATAYGISRELGLGLTEVSRLAQQYGIELAGGINPILGALGKRQLHMATGRGFQPNADGNLYEQHQAEIAPGGAWRVWAEPETGGEAYIPLAPAKRARSMEIWRETGRRLDAPEVQYFAAGGFSTAADVPKPRSTAPYQAPISTAGDATMQRGYDDVVDWLRDNVEAAQGGTAGSAAVGGAWTSLWNLVKGQIPQARINSTYRPGDPGYHGRNKAIDFGYGTGPGGAGSAGLASINRLLHDQVGRNLAELIYNGVGDDRPNLKNGQPLAYSRATQLQHRNHVHAAVRDTGGMLPPGFSLLGNFTGGNENMAVFTTPQWETLQSLANAEAASQFARSFYNGTTAAVTAGIRQGMTSVATSLANATVAAQPVTATTQAASSYKWDESREGDPAYTAWWDGLMAAGWKGRAGDREERIYAPAAMPGYGAAAGAGAGGCRCGSRSPPHRSRCTSTGRSGAAWPGSKPRPPSSTASPRCRNGCCTTREQPPPAAHPPSFVTACCQGARHDLHAAAGRRDERPGGQPQGTPAAAPRRPGRRRGRGRLPAAGHRPHVGPVGGCVAGLRVAGHVRPHGDGPRGTPEALADPRGRRLPAAPPRAAHLQRRRSPPAPAQQGPGARRAPDSSVLIGWRGYPGPACGRTQWICGSGWWPRSMPG
jgi:hypothetical protein